MGQEPTSRLNQFWPLWPNVIEKETADVEAHPTLAVTILFSLPIVTPASAAHRSTAKPYIVVLQEAADPPSVAAEHGAAQTW